MLQNGEIKIKLKPILRLKTKNYEFVKSNEIDY